MGEIEKTCRLCLSNDQFQMSLFSQYCIEKELQKKIYECLQLTVRREDSLSEYVCYNCIGKLETFYNFKNNAIQCHKPRPKSWQVIRNGKKTGTTWQENGDNNLSKQRFLTSYKFGKGKGLKRKADEDLLERDSNLYEEELYAFSEDASSWKEEQSIGLFKRSPDEDSKLKNRNKSNLPSNSLSESISGKIKSCSNDKSAVKFNGGGKLFGSNNCDNSELKINKSGKLIRSQQLSRDLFESQDLEEREEFNLTPNVNIISKLHH